MSLRKEYIFTDGHRLLVGTMYGIGRNYALHAKEMGGGVPAEPIVFIKPPATYITNGDTILLPSFSNNIHHEVELVVVIGKDCESIEARDAINFIAGYAVGIDVTLRDIQSQAKKVGNPWAVAKGFVTSAPISKIISQENFGNEIPQFDLELKVNGETRQTGSTANMERPVEMLIEYLSRIFTLQKGDCIFTGTPEGVGQIKSGDSLEAELKDYIKLNVECKNNSV